MNIWEGKEINVKPRQWHIALWNAPVPTGNHFMVYSPFESFPTFLQNVGTHEPNTLSTPFPLHPNLLEFPHDSRFHFYVLAPLKTCYCSLYWSE